MAFDLFPPAGQAAPPKLRGAPADALLASLYRWDGQEGGGTVPPWLQRDLSQAEAHMRLEECRRDVLAGGYVDDPDWLASAKAVRQHLSESIDDAGRRCQARLELADYVERVGLARNRPELIDAAMLMRECRQSGLVGESPDHAGHSLCCWDRRCDLGRLCPDEARRETMRLSEKVPAILEWRRTHPKHRLFFVVFTIPNVPAGQLKTAKRDAFERYKKLIVKNRDLPHCRASMTTQEDPLSAAGTWNVHINAILGWKGEMSFESLRRLWIHDLRISEITGDERELNKAVLELVKYSARTVGDKSAEKFAAGETKAPPMTRWPPDLFLEWWQAQATTKPDKKGRPRRSPFRRTRTYGAFYKLKTQPRTFSITDKNRWFGQIFWNPATVSYDVILILGNKSFAPRCQSDNLIRPQPPEYHATDPP